MTTVAPPLEPIAASCAEHDSAHMREPRTSRPAARAAARLSVAILLLGALGLGSSLLILSRLFASWRVTGQPASHVISLFGQRLSYPAADAGAIAIAVLAGVGLLMSGAAVRSVLRDLLASRRFGRLLAAGLPVPLGDAWIIGDERPQAFCAGLWRPRVYVSRGALNLLDEPALAAVLAHERHHAQRHDPLRLVCGRALRAGLFIAPAVSRLTERHRALAEIGADEAAVLADGVERSALASAMLSFSEAADADGAGLDPERVDHLLGGWTPWRFPLLPCVITAASLVVLVALAVLLAHAAAGSATLAPPFLSSQPCIVVLASLPTAAAFAGVAAARARRARHPVAPTNR
jgi:Zn-dependent protease with chaperone function